MDLGLKGKVALIAGASQGMGRATALGFAREGAKVSICARGEAALNEAAAMIRKENGGEVMTIVADMSKPEDIKRFVNDSAQHFGRLDIIVNNAGGPPPGEFMKFTDEDWNNAYNLSFMSTMRMTREAVPHMETLLRRAVATGVPVNSLIKVLVNFATAVWLENVHPLQGGILRLKHPSERRPGFPREPAIRFWPLYILQ